ARGAGRPPSGGGFSPSERGEGAEGREEHAHQPGGLLRGVHRHADPAHSRDRGASCTGTPTSPEADEVVSGSGATLRIQCGRLGAWMRFGSPSLVTKGFTRYRQKAGYGALTGLIARGLGSGVG